MPSNQTPNYKLSQWERADKVQMEDFNADNAKIDAALKAETDARTALAAQVAKRGNCQIWAATYTGTGVYGKEHPNTLAFPRPPLLVMIFNKGDTPPIMIAPRGTPRVCPFRNGHNFTSTYVTWSGNNMIWWSDVNAYNQMNSEKNEFTVIAFLSMD